jgi:DNA-binding transcriptional LysR family regulator
LDLAILDDPKPRRGLLTKRLLPLRPGIYCGPGHPLYGVHKVTLEEVQEHPFVAPPQAGDDDWPEELPRKIGMHVNVLYLGVLVCASARLLACLPAPVADAYGEVHGSGVQLWRVPIDVCRESWLYAVRRHPVGKRGRAESVLDAIRHEVEARRALRSPKR